MNVKKCLQRIKQTVRRKTREELGAGLPGGDWRKVSNYMETLRVHRQLPQSKSVFFPSGRAIV
jgi:hypothetical protein